MGVLCFILANFAVLLACFCLSDMLFHHRSTRIRMLTAISAFPILTWLIVTCFGSTGLLTREYVTLAAIGAAVAAVTASVVRKKKAEPAYPRRVLRTVTKPAGPTPHLLLASACFGGLASVHVLSATLFGTHFVWDDLSYHAPAVAHWVVDRRLSLAPFWYQAYYPLNSELFSLWFILPTGGDGYASLGGLYWLLLLTVAAVVLIRGQGGGRTAALLGGSLLMASSVVSASTMTFSATDLAGPALMMATVAVLSPSPVRGQSHPSCPSWREAFFSGLLIGLAAGVKVSLAPVALVVLIWTVLTQERGERLRRGLRLGGIFLLGVVATGSYWYVRNLWLTGNPLFPAEFGPIDGPFHSHAQDRTKLISWLTTYHASPGEWVRAIGVAIWWPIGAFLLAVIGLARGAAYLIRQRRTILEADKRTLLLLLLLAVILLALFPWTPFSGTADAPDAELKILPRYLILPFAAGIVLFCVLAARKHPATGRYDLASSPPTRAERDRGIVWLFVFLVLFSCPWGPHPLRSIAASTDWGSGYVAEAIPALVFLLGGAIALAAWNHWPVGGPWRRAKGFWLAVLGPVLIVLCAISGLKQRMTDQMLYRYEDQEPRVGAFWRELERLPAGGRIAFFGPRSYQYYALFGRGYQLRPCHVEADGRLAAPLHEIWQANPDQVRWWSAWHRPPPDLGKLIVNLQAANIDYVWVTKWDDDYWVPQYQVLMDSPITKLRYDDGYSVLLEIEPLEKPGTTPPHEDTSSVSAR